MAKRASGQRAKTYLVGFKEVKMWQERNRTADTEIFSLLLVAGLCVAIGRQLNEFKRLTPL
jgi:hypothetical protein